MENATEITNSKNIFSLNPQQYQGQFRDVLFLEPNQSYEHTPEIVILDKDGNKTGICYNYLTLMMLNEMKKQKTNIIEKMSDTDALNNLKNNQQVLFFESENNELKIAYQKSNGIKTIYAI